MNREEFIELSGGIFTSRKRYENYTLDDKYKHFWSFYTGVYKKNGKEYTDEDILTIYAGVEIDDVRQREKFSIEHIIPISFTQRYLRRQNNMVKNGAACNPFNFAASHRKVNSQRSSWPFDFDDDEVVRKDRLNIKHSYTDYGLDHENEWVVPTKSRGDVARSILYMSLIYNIKEFYGRDVVALVKWARVDPPGFWEKKYNVWVHRQYKIQNPFIQDLTGEYKPYDLLNDYELLNSLNKKKSKHKSKRMQKFFNGRRGR